MCQSTEEEMQAVKVAFGEIAEICLSYVLKCLLLCISVLSAIFSYSNLLAYNEV